ncbi:MAG: peptide chain release factor 1 [Candidatus Saccharimonadales bacterium]
MEDKRDKLQAEYDLLSKRLEDPSIYTTDEGQQVAKKHSDIGEVLDIFKQIDELNSSIDSTRAMVDGDDEELAELAEAELAELEAELDKYEIKLEAALIPKDPNDDKAAVVEIRAGAGGDEASLFAGELYRMYIKYCEMKNWKIELINESHSDAGGFKEISFSIDHKGAYGELKFESGVHRVQRVPATESSGRLHTSTASVAVLPEAEEHDIEIQESDIRVDVFRSSGPGGQSVNTTDSAVRITHIPTGMVVSCQDQKSQHKNREKALGVLRSRLLAMKIEEEEKSRADQRKNQIGSGDRSEKIRTYNFPQDRLTDHRINFTTHDLAKIMEGNIDEIIQALKSADLELKKQQS